MIELDGSRHSGSGTLVRFGVALAALTGRPLRVVNARESRPKPGLAGQHVAAIRACAELSDAETRGVALGVLPLACLAEAPLRVRITGGVFQDFAPSPHHLAHVPLPLLARMGASAELEVLRPGYARGGEGQIELRVRPARRALTSLILDDPGSLSWVGGVALASHLAVADALHEDLASGATTDRHLADHLVIFAALADGVSRFSVPRLSAHVQSNLWLAELFGARPRLDGTRVEVAGFAQRPR
ncbi:MAG: RNA 3'-terminal phosphate cyclase [Myxococcota bacterium]